MPLFIGTIKTKYNKLLQWEPILCLSEIPTENLPFIKKSYQLLSKCSKTVEGNNLFRYVQYISAGHWWMIFFLQKGLWKELLHDFICWLVVKQFNLSQAPSPFRFFWACTPSPPFVKIIIFYRKKRYVQKHEDPAYAVKLSWRSK